MLQHDVKSNIKGRNVLWGLLKHFIHSIMCASGQVNHYCARFTVCSTYSIKTDRDNL